ncbi:glycosyltransferase family 2 protein, partial [archaeon]|nr:glycosyltransferase family 2 protein [archaeon]
MNYPKVLVGCPTSVHKDYCLNNYIEGLNKLTYPNFDILLVDNSDGDSYFKKIKEKNIPIVKLDLKDEILRIKLAKSRNILRKKVLEKKYDYFLSLEQDVVPPKNIIERLLKHNKEIITGVYYNYFFSTYPPGLKPLLWRTSTQKEFEDIKNSDDPIYLPIKEMIRKEKITDPKKIRARFKCEELEEPKLVEIFMSGLGCTLI